MSKPVVLIVDDEPDVVTMWKRSLLMEGFDVLCAYDGISAVDMAEVDRPDLILRVCFSAKLFPPPCLFWLRQRHRGCNYESRRGCGRYTVGRSGS